MPKWGRSCLSPGLCARWNFRPGKMALKSYLHVLSGLLFAYAVRHSLRSACFSSFAGAEDRLAATGTGRYRCRLPLNAPERHRAWWAIRPEQESLYRMRSTKGILIYHVRDPGKGFFSDALRHAAISNLPDAPAAHLQRRMELNMRARIRYSRRSKFSG